MTTVLTRGRETTLRESRNLVSGWLVAWGLLGLGLNAFGQTQPPAAIKEQVSLTRPALVLSYPEGKTFSVKLKGTPRLPRANVEAKV